MVLWIQVHTSPWKGGTQTVLGGGDLDPQQLVWWNHFAQRPHPHLNREARLGLGALLWFKEGASGVESAFVIQTPVLRISLFNKQKTKLRYRQQNGGCQRGRGWGLGGGQRGQKGVKYKVTLG